jgi:uncharacterized protein (TIGR02117 family)
MTAVARRQNIAHIVVAALLLGVGCSPLIQPESAGRTRDDRRIFVVHDNWHAAIVFKKADLGTDLIPEAEDFSSVEYVEFSWGDADYFETPDAGILLALRAAFWSRGSVLHVVGVERTLQEHFRPAEIIQVPVSDEAFQRLGQFLSAHFDRADSSVRATARPGLTPNARFYPSTGRFSIARTCNTWVAEALQYAGLPVTSAFVVTAANLASQVRPLGIVVE